MTDENTENTAPEDADAASRDDAAAPEDSPSEVEALHAKIDEMKSTIAYAMAEADNARKRAARDVADAKTYAVQRFAADLLSVTDNFSRALDALTPQMRDGMGEAGRTLLTGVEMTQKEMISVLARHGVQPVATQPGDRFDPNLHQATAQIPSEHAAGTVAAVLQDGWTLGERTLRAAMVAVSNGETPIATAEPTAPATDSVPGATVDTKA